MSKPPFAIAATERALYSHDPCQSLWAEVIKQALRDAKRYGFRHGADGLNTNESAHWLLADHRDFYFVCDLAGVEPTVIREQTRRVMLR